MRVGIIADVHGNWEALTAVLNALSGLGVTTLWCLGDTVGYGANPKECLSEVRHRCAIVLQGNHDAAVAWGHSLEWFNPIAREAVLWTREQLTEKDREALSHFPPQFFLTLESPNLPSLWLVHGSLRDPLEEYILDPSTASLNLSLLAEGVKPSPSQKPFPLVLLFAHTHIAEAYFIPPKSQRLHHRSFLTGGTLPLEPEGIYLLNCGSVGQPRDENPMASFGVLDTETLTFHVTRIPYDIETAARKILQAGLPQELAFRLYQGW